MPILGTVIGALASAVEEASLAVLDELGPGWSEAIYQRALETELRIRGYYFETQRALPVRYRGHVVGCCVPDFVVWGEGLRLVVDLKAIDYLRIGDETQVKRYVRELSSQVEETVEGLLVNFSTAGSKKRLGDADGDDLQVVGIR